MTLYVPRAILGAPDRGVSTSSRRGGRQLHNTFNHREWYFMNKLWIAACLALSLSPVAFAADAKEGKEPTAQQVRMKECNQKAADKKGDERKKFMSECLSGKEAEPKVTAQQERMKECNQKATGMKGDERKKFMSTCLSGKEPEAKMTQQEKMSACNKKAGDKKGDERKKFMSECLKG